MSLPTLDDNDKGKYNGLPKMDMPPIENNNMPSLDSLDDSFEELPVDNLYNESEELSDNEEFYEDIDDDSSKVELPNMKKEKERELSNEDDYYPEYEEDELEDEDKFIDKKKLKLLPFGGKKSKSKKLVKSSDFDDRKNKLAKTKMIQFVIILTIILLFLIGLKNTFAPNHVYTSEQIKEFAKEGSGQTNFPNERGKAFAENFMLAYLTLDKTRPELIEMLEHYYGERSGGNNKVLNLEWSSPIKQNVIIPPKVENVELLGDYSARYELSAYVSNFNGESVIEKELDGKWLSFSVNVFYDDKKDTIAVTQDSPSIIPYKRIAKTLDTPEIKSLGNGVINSDILPAITPTIDGFIEAYGKSSFDSHNSIIQYISDKEDISLYDGFGGEVELNSNHESSIRKVVFETDSEGVYEVLVTVDWKDSKSNEENAIVYTSKYEMRIITDGSGKYLVSKFSPAKYYK